MKQDLESPDVVVIGGGPAGSTVSTLLAQQKVRVELFERARGPSARSNWRPAFVTLRFRVGHSKRGVAFRPALPSRWSHVPVGLAAVGFERRRGRRDKTEPRTQERARLTPCCSCEISV